MQPFEYANPTSVKEAVGLLGSTWGEVEPLAGGTDLISMMKEYLVTPKRVVNLKNIKELSGIHNGKELRIGATVTFDELAENADVRKLFPSVTEAAHGVTSPQIRNMGTVGGDLCQRPRCWYFRGGHGLFGMDKDGAALIPDGHNKYHAILGNSGPAYFVSPSSLGPALIALNAKIKVVSSSGTREIPADKFFVTPKDESSRETALKPNELVTEILIPHSDTKNATYEVRQKEALDWPLATASVSLKMKGSTVQSARIVLGAVAPTPWPATAAEQALAGQTITVQVAEEAGNAAVTGAKALTHNGYKVQLARVAVKRALLSAAGVRA